MHGKPNRDNNINFIWYLDGETTDEEIIETYKDRIPGLTADLKGKPELNELMLEQSYQQNLNAIREKLIKEGSSYDDANNKATKEADRMKEEAIMNYEAAVEFNEIANGNGEN